ncbi:MAG: Na+:solute symporter [bacterium]|nr:Na+:solute symporter [bacterium]
MLSFLDWTVLVIYLLVSVVVGLWLTKRSNSSTEEYFLSGRNLPWWLLGTSIVATTFSSDTPLYVTNLVRKGGVSENWQWWSFAIGGILGAVWLAPLWRRAGIMTDVELTEIRYSGKAAAFLRAFRGIWLAVLVNCIGMGWVMLGMAKITYVCFGWDKVTALFILCSITLFYTLLGGLWGVVLTDFVQFIIAQVGAILLAFYSVNAVGGINKLRDFLENSLNWKELNQSIVYGPGFLPNEPTAFIPAILNTQNVFNAAFGAFLVYTLVQWWANLNSDGGGKVIQRLLAAKNEKHALGGFLWFNIAHYSIRTWPWVITALASLMLYPTMTDHELAYPKLMVDLLPNGVLGIMLASFMAAFMSTITSQINWGASYLLNDVYRRFLVRNKNDHHYLKMSWLFSTLVLLFGAIAAYLANSVTTTFQFVITLGSGVGPIYLLRWLWWRINAWSELIALAVSTVLAATWTFLQPPWATFSIKLFLTAFPTFFIAIVVSLLTKPTEKKRLIEFYKKTTPPGWWKPIQQLDNQNIATEQSHRKRQNGSDIIIHWCLGLILIFGTLFGIGSMLLKSFLWGVVISFLGILSGVVLYRRLYAKN